MGLIGNGRPVIALIDIHTGFDSEKIDTANRQVIDFANIKAK